MLPVAKGVNNMSNLNHLLQKNKKILNKFPENPNQDVLELSLFLPSDNCLLHEKTALGEKVIKGKALFALAMMTSNFVKPNNTLFNPFMTANTILCA